LTLDSGGCSFAYKCAGSGDAVVLIQGAGIHGDGWLPQTDELSASFRCLTFDNRGMGASQPSARRITVEQMAEDTLALMDETGFQTAHVVGHSLGGLVAQQIALTARDRVRSLALLCTSARGADATALTLQMLALGLRTRIGPRRMRARAFLEIIMPRQYLATQDLDSLAERMLPLFGHDLADSPPIVMAQLNALKRFDATPRLRELAGIPTLVLSAAHDIIFRPHHGRALADGIPGATYLEIPNAAHGVPIQEPQAVNDALLRHFAAA